MNNRIELIIKIQIFFVKLAGLLKNLEVSNGHCNPIAWLSGRISQQHLKIIPDGPTKSDMSDYP